MQQNKSEDTATRGLFTLEPSWRTRGEALAKVVLFLIASTFLFSTAMRTFKPKLNLTPQGSILGFLHFQWIHVLYAVLIPVALLLFVFREPIQFAGVGRRIRWKQLGFGFLVGVVLIAAVISVLFLLGDYAHGPLLLSPAQILGYGAVYVVTMLLVALSEEGVFRGYALVQFSRGISFWPAAIVSSVLFGLGHAANGGMTSVGVCSVILAGMMLSYAFRRTGAVYFGVGFHAAWDGGTTFLFGAVAVGLRLPNTLFQAKITGPAWLTGASAGPIGGALGFAAFLIAAGIVHVCYKPVSTS